MKVFVIRKWYDDSIFIKETIYKNYIAKWARREQPSSTKGYETLSKIIVSC